MKTVKIKMENDRAKFKEKRKSSAAGGYLVFDFYFSKVALSTIDCYSVRPYTGYTALKKVGLVIF